MWRSGGRSFGVEPICRALGVPVSTHYARRSREPSPRELADLGLLGRDRGPRAPRNRAYGARKTWKELRRRGVEVGRDQVARVMRQHGIEGKLRGGKKRTTIPDETAVDGPATCCSATSRRRPRTRNGSPTSPTCAPGRASSTSRSCSTATAA